MGLADVVINDGQGTPVAHTFVYVTTENGRVIRKDMARTPDLPLIMEIGHNKVKRSGVVFDGHLWRINDSRMDADGVTVRNASIRVIVECDPQIYSDALSDDLMAWTRNMLTQANGRLLLRGSVL